MRIIFILIVFLTTNTLFSQVFDSQIESDIELIFRSNNYDSTLTILHKGRYNITIKNLYIAKIHWLNFQFDSSYHYYNKVYTESDKGSNIKGASIYGQIKYHRKNGDILELKSFQKKKPS